MGLVQIRWCGSVLWRPVSFRATKQRCQFVIRSLGSPNEWVRPTDQLTGGPTTPNRMRAMVVPGELIESRGDWSLVQPSTVPPPLVRIERYWCHRSVNSRLWQASFQPRMRSLAIIVMLKIEQLRLEIDGR